MNLTPEQIAERLADRNPFATRSVRPGAIKYRFLNGFDAEQLVETLRQQGWRGEIHGPHGSGKSTLVQSLIPVLEAAGRQVRAFTLRMGESRLPVSGKDMQTWGPSTQVIIDGYEQLGSWTRMQIGRVCKGKGCGLLVTSHEPAGLPTLLETSPSLEIAQALVRDIQPCRPLRVHDQDVQRSFAKHAGNIRELFFELYDLYEQRRT